METPRRDRNRAPGPPPQGLEHCRPGRLAAATRPFRVLEVLAAASCVGLGLSLWTLADVPAAAQTPNVAGESGAPRIRLGYYVDPLDKFDRTLRRSSLDSWSSGFATPRFPSADLRMFYDDAQFRKSMDSGQLDALVLYGYQFVELRRRFKIEPAMLFGEKSSPHVKLILLVRKNAGIESLSGLRGKRILADTARLGRLPLIWLRRCLAAEGVRDDVNDFAQLEPVPDAFHALAPVFFGNADACILTRTGYTRNAQFNGDIVKRLHILLESNPLASRVLAFPANTDPAKKRTILDQGALLPPAVFRQSFIGPDLHQLTGLSPGDLASVGDLARLEIPPMSVHDFYSDQGQEDVTTTIDNRPKPEGGE